MDTNSEIQKYFLGYYDVNENISADGLHSVLCNPLKKFNVQNKLIKLIAQTYNGISVISGN